MDSWCKCSGCSAQGASVRGPVRLAHTKRGGILSLKEPIAKELLLQGVSVVGLKAAEAKKKLNELSKSGAWQRALEWARTEVIAMARHFCGDHSLCARVEGHGHKRSARGPPGGAVRRAEGVPSRGT